MKRPDITYDALRNTQNYNQNIDQFPRALCVCSGGLLRSPTTALVLSMEPFNYNTRSAGIDFHHALTCVDDVLMEWADLIVVMNNMQKDQINDLWPDHGKLMVVLNIPDAFRYRDGKLVAMIKERFPPALKAAEDERRARLAKVYPTAEPVPEKPVFDGPKEGQGPKLPPVGEPGSDDF